MKNNLFLTVSIVVFKPKIDLLIQTLETLIYSCNNANIPSYKIYLINNENKLPNKI